VWDIFVYMCTNVLASSLEEQARMVIAMEKPMNARKEDCSLIFRIKVFVKERVTLNYCSL
jgi:hypothetical protein